MGSLLRDQQASSTAYCRLSSDQVNSGMIHATVQQRLTVEMFSLETCKRTPRSTQSLSKPPHKWVPSCSPKRLLKRGNKSYNLFLCGRTFTGMAEMFFSENQTCTRDNVSRLSGSIRCARVEGRLLSSWNKRHHRSFSRLTGSVDLQTNRGKRRVALDNAHSALKTLNSACMPSVL